MSQQVIMVSSPAGDWQGLYVDGLLVVQNHNLTARDVLVSLGIEFRDILAQEEWLDTLGSLPAMFSDVAVEN